MDAYTKQVIAATLESAKVRPLAVGLEQAVYDLASELEALRADAERWRGLYRRAINEANGLTNYVEDRPELRSAERRLAAIEDAARTGGGTP